MKIPAYDDIKGPRRSHEWLGQHYPEFHKMLLQKYPESSLQAALYMYYNAIDEHPKCPCGKLLEYRSPKLGFRTYCSIKCATNSKEVQEKTKRSQKERYGGVGFASKQLANKAATTNLERYGVINGMQCEQIRSKLEQTNLERYGACHAMSNPEIASKVKHTQEKRYGGFGLASDLIKSKATQTMLERYGGVGCYSKESKHKARTTCLERYGVEHITQSPEHVQRIKISRAVSIKKKYPIIQKIIWQNGTKIYECKCPHPGSCNRCPGTFRIFNEQFYRRVQDGTELCTVLLPYQHPNQSNTSVEVFIKMILDKHNIRYIQNDRTLIAPREVDFYLPDYKFAIECNGVRWHSSEFKERGYHQQKYIDCLNRDVQLLTIWEDWIINSPKIVESIILSKLHIIENKIWARKCAIKHVNSSEATIFLIQNHIQGQCVASVYYGLYYNDELVSLMSFGKKRPTISGESWELIRFCNKVDTNVVGAASRLLKRFIRQYNPNQIVSFSSNDISNGHLYNVLGFENVGSNQSYWYIGRDFKRYHRFSFCKAKLVKMGYSVSKTEREIMRELPFYRIDDSGQTKWVLKKEEQ